MKIFSSKINRLFWLIFLLSFVGCAAHVKGRIFLDDNADNIKDADESYIANLSFTVTKDDEDFATGQTDSTGYYSVRTRGKGTYCVTISDSDLSGTNDDGTEPSLTSLQKALLDPKFQKSSALLKAVTTSESDCSDELDDDDDGDIDCDDSDCADDTACTDETETDCDDEIDDDDDGDIDCDDSDCASDAACDEDTTTVESRKACGEGKNLNLTLDVPVARDYETAIADASDPSTYEVSRGDTVSIAISYPDSCAFSVLDLPSLIIPVDPPSGSYDSSTGEFDLEEAIATDGVTTAAAETVADDPLSTYTFSAEIDDDGATAAVTDNFTPEVTCPDDSTVTLKTFTFEIAAE